MDFKSEANRVDFVENRGESKQSLGAWRITTGRKGEDLAASTLENLGYRLLFRNYREGRSGEIDLIAETPHGVLVFLEVKTVLTLSAGHPLEKITSHKKVQLQKLALRFCHKHQCLHREIRFDAIGIVWNEGNPVVEHITNAFLPSLSGYQFR
jgi:putative endonuclease